MESFCIWYGIECNLLFKSKEKERKTTRNKHEGNSFMEIEMTLFKLRVFLHKAVCFPCSCIKIFVKYILVKVCG